VQSNTQSTSWYSPSATNHTVPCADLRCLRDAKAFGDVALVRDAYLGQMFKHHHMFCYEYKSSTAERFWIYPLRHFPDSSVLSIRMQSFTVTVAGEQLQWFEPNLNSEPFFTSILVLDDSDKACSVQAHSWAWQFRKIPAFRKGRAPAIRIFRDGIVESVMGVACRNAFWLLPRSVIVEYATYFKIAVPAGSSLFEVLCCVIGSYLDLNEVEALRYVHMRMVSLARSTRFSTELLEIDEALEVLDHNDIHAVTERQKTALETLASKNAFINEYVLAKSKHAGGEPPPSVGKKWPAAVPLVFPQADVKKYAPPGASVWRGNIRAEWCGHAKPCSRILEKLSNHGNDERATILAMLRRLWVEYNRKEGKPLNSCPIEHLFSAAG
jgi:hypothetical protein